MTAALIALNLLVFLFQATRFGEEQRNLIITFGSVPLLITRDVHLLPRFPQHWFAIISSMFLHGGWLHLGGNMLYLWIFGNNIEDCLGRIRFLVFYLLCGVAAVIAQTIMNTNSPVPMIGASGAISGILGAYLILYPRAKVVTLVWFLFFIRFVSIPAFIVLGIWFLMQLPGALGGEGGIAWFAHLGGFVFGVLTIRFFGGRKKPPYAFGWIIPV